jgi:hypothetical protein
MTFSEGGKQYISIVSGKGGVVAKFFGASVPWLATVPPGSMVYTWVLNAPAVSSGSSMSVPNAMASAPSGAMPAPVASGSR